MASPATLLIQDNIREWLRARGFWLIVLTALVPPLLTGAWVFTHQNDVAPTHIEHDGGAGGIEEGQLVNITAVVENLHDGAAGAFNATIQVGFFEQRLGSEELVFRERHAQEFRVDGLGPGERQEITANWTAQAGTFIFRVLVDTDDELPEIEENNNDRFVQVQVGFPSVQIDFDPTGELGEAEEGLPESDAAVLGVSWEPAEIFRGDPANVTVQVRNGDADVTNATVRLQVHRATGAGYSPFPSPSLSETINLAAGEIRDVRFAWTPNQIGQYALVGSLDVSASARDTNSSDNAVIQETFIDRQFLYEEPEEKATAKAFYRTVLEVLHLKLLIPLVGLFYAAGVLQDEREKGNLAYLLTRPVPRWALPVARFAVSFVVAGVALVIGVLATYLLLLGLPQEAPGHLYWPLTFSLVTLLVYGAVFSLVGVYFERPYLVGLLYALGWEALIFLGRSVLVNGRPLLQDWVLYLSLNSWVTKAFDGWDPDQPTQFFPVGDEAVRAFWIILAIAAASLAGAAFWMKRREFDV